MTTASQTGEQTDLKELAPGVFAVITPQGGANAGFVVGPDYVVVIDSRMTPTLSRELRDLVAQATDRPIRFLIDTHYHGDHTMGNQWFAPAADIIAHVNCRDRLAAIGAAYYQSFFKMRPELTSEWAQVKVVLPTITVRDRLELHLGDRRVEVRYLGAGHADDQLVVHLPQDRVLFANDYVFNRITPAMHDADFEGWLRCLAAIEQIVNVDVVVPGHGLLGTLDEVRRIKDFIQHFCDQAAACYDRGIPVEEAAASVKLDRYTDWPLQADRLPIAVRRYYRERSARRKH